jgi:hypothetical protein
MNKKLLERTKYTNNEIEVIYEIDYRNKKISIVNTD